jgi:D-alanyl-D-alanine dipeptidase
MDERSHHGATGISGSEAYNRLVLRSIMENSGFIPYDYEWWHYMLQNEPYPDRYFDFPVL